MYTEELDPGHPDVVQVCLQKPMIQYRMKLTDDTLIQCKPYPSPYATREELRHEVDSMLEMGVVCVDFRKLNKITKVYPEPMTTSEDLFC